MIKETLQHLDHGFFSTAALVLFLLVFIAVSIKTCFTDSRVTDEQADIPLFDGSRDNS